MADNDTTTLPFNPHPLSFSDPASAIRRTIERHRVWIEQILATSLEDSIYIRADFDLTRIALDKFRELPGRTSRHLGRMRLAIRKVELPPGYPALISLTEKNSEEQQLHTLLGGLPPVLRPIGLNWEDCPIALYADGHAHPMIAMNIDYIAAPNSSAESTAHMLITPRTHASRALRFVSYIDSPDRRPRLYTANGSTRPVARLSWDDLVLDENVISLLRQDFDLFWQREEWFRERKIPFRRGYLLHGPPGNGKTSAVRAMLSSRGLTAYTLRMFNRHVDDDMLEAVFERATRHRPAVVLLEDLDRAFPRTGESRSPLSLQALLNCLDGVATADGSVVIGTANQPELLDPAILRRPGRFDRVVFFSNPKGDLRERYFRKMNAGFETVDLAQVVEESDGFSFAQLREAYILAGQSSFIRTGDLTVDDLLQAIRSLKGTMRSTHREGASGFRSDIRK